MQFYKRDAIARRTVYTAVRRYGARMGRRKASRIRRAGNRHLRRALYMPALVASRCDLHAKAFFESLLARKKARLQGSLLLPGSCCTPYMGYFGAA